MRPSEKLLIEGGVAALGIGLFIDWQSGLGVLLMFWLTAFALRKRGHGSEKASERLVS